jgi:hypothetical protein
MYPPRYEVDTKPLNIQMTTGLKADPPMKCQELNSSGAKGECATIIDGFTAQSRPLLDWRPIRRDNCIVCVRVLDT